METSQIPVTLKVGVHKATGTLLCLAVFVPNDARAKIGWSEDARFDLRFNSSGRVIVETVTIGGRVGHSPGDTDGFWITKSGRQMSIANLRRIPSFAVAAHYDGTLIMSDDPVLKYLVGEPETLSVPVMATANRDKAPELPKLGDMDTGRWLRDELNAWLATNSAKATVDAKGLVQLKVEVTL